MLNTEMMISRGTARPARLWTPRRVLFTPAALQEPWGQQIYRRVTDLGLPIEELKTNRLTALRGPDERTTYANAKRTMAVVTAPAGAFKLQPIPPSADWQFHLAQGCPAHCQYCYLAGSLQGRRSCASTQIFRRSSRTSRLTSALTS